MVQIDKDMLRRIQMVQLELLEEVDRICKKCRIQYSIIAGTMLGAVRHGGFIPWDDDADVALLREEYERFRYAVKTELDTSRFYFQDNRRTKGYRWGYGKLRRKNTLFLREHQEHMPYQQGIFIDIFPLDGVPDNYLLRSMKNFECFCVRKILWSKVGQVADKSLLKRRWYRLLAKIPEDRIWKHYNKMVFCANSKTTKMVRILMFPTPNREYGYYRHWYEESADVMFEGKIFQGIKDYDGYLCFKFGEYNKFPPIKERKTHPVSAIELI